jgi:diaminopimelate decarboxylase
MSHVEPRLHVIIAGTDDASGCAAGIARAVRRRLPAASITALDIGAVGADGHDPAFDDVRIAQCHDDALAAVLRLRSTHANGAIVLPASWWWARLLASQRPTHAPDAAALDAVALPMTSIAVATPPWIPLSDTDEALDRFCQHHDWRIWLRGPRAPARRIDSWIALRSARCALGTDADRCRLQADIAGHHEHVALVARQGHLLGCVAAHHYGPTYCIQPASAAARDLVAAVVAATRWTGGAMAHWVCDHAGTHWLIAWQPHFPEWVDGAAQAGWDLIGPLLVPPHARIGTGTSATFARITIDVPLRHDVPIVPVERRHPHMDAPPSRVGAPAVPALVLDIADAITTPARVDLPAMSAARFGHVAQLAHQASAQAGIAIGVAYSIKTDPDPLLMRLAHTNGMLVDAISQHEVAFALRCGFAPERIVLNGPAKHWPTPAAPLEQMHTVFCDSLAELAEVASRLRAAQRIGVRLRPTAVPSRFGIPVGTPAERSALVDALRRMPQQRLAVHLHMASSVVGIGTWWHLVAALAEQAAALAADSQCDVELLDLGGGWAPQAFRERLLPSLGAAALQWRALLPHLDTILVEPGKALAQEAACLVMRTLERRSTAPGTVDIVVDGSITELPDLASYPHPCHARHPDGSWHALGRGNDRILGRTCWEADIIADDVALPDWLGAGTLLAVADAGAYDRSMAYVFGQGS